MNTEMVEQIIAMQAVFKKWYLKGKLVGIGAHEVHIDDSAMTEIAPLSEWELNNFHPEHMWPYEHLIRVNGLLFSAVTKEKIDADHWRITASQAIKDIYGDDGSGSGSGT